MNKRLVLYMLLGLLYSCSLTKNYNDPTGVRQMVWEKQSDGGKYYLNRFQVRKALFESKKEGDYFTLTKTNYLGAMRRVEKKNNKE